ncbi:tetratricopeptide repeat protein, partial [Brasilonema sp. CT11]|nr:tetratricopeptide repeat protein [Brasilonema sp. CT11]
MKFYHVLIAILIGILIVLVQPQLIIAHNSNQVTRIILKVAVPSSSQYLDPDLVLKQEGKNYPVLTTVHGIEAPGKPYKKASIATAAKVEDFLTQGKHKYDHQEYKGAIKDYTQALQIDPNNANTYGRRGDARAKLKDYQGAIEDYTQALRIDSNSAISAINYRERGNVRYDLGDKQGAMEDYTQALRINPNNANAYNNRGNVRYDL